MSAFSIYLHIPYCQTKCPYCDFNSYASEAWPEAQYTAALQRELGHYAALTPWRGGDVRTIFFGGGTPSLFSASSIGAVLETIARTWTIADAAEITLEANPGTVHADKLRDLRAAGINRISFGVQSFLPHHLQRLGRIHDADQARSAVRGAHSAGFESINIDLIYALPQQTLAEWQHDLEAGIALGPQHVSAYNLTYEEGTAFHQWRAQGKLHQLPEELEVAMFNVTQERLQAAGFAAYEISNYAQPGQACRHNLNYWCSGAYLGVGAGAHGFAWPGAAGSHGERWGNERHPSRYMSAVEKTGWARTTQEQLDARQARGEFVFLALRCRSGCSAPHFQQRFDIALCDAFPHVAELQKEGLLAYDGDHWKLTERGLLLADSVFATFL